MTEEDYSRIGKVLKRLNPGRWDGNTDEEVAIVTIQMGGFIPNKYLEAKAAAESRIQRILDQTNGPGFFGSITGVRAARRRAEISQHQLTISRNQIEQIRLEFDREMLPEHLAVEEYLRELQNRLVAATAKAQTIKMEVDSELRRKAAAKSLTLETYEELVKMKVQSELDYQNHHAREHLAKEIRVEEYNLQLNALNVQARHGEKERDLKVAKLERFLDEYYVLINTDMKNDDLKIKKLDIKRQEIELLNKELYGVGRTHKA